MSNDVRKIILGTLAGFLVLLTLWMGFLFVVACGGSLQCSKANPTPVRTSIPTLIPASLPTAQLGVAQGVSLKCRVGAISLLQAWINSGYPETDPFEFQDSTGTACTATFADVSPLFKEGNTWYSGALPCASCHNSDLAKASAHLDLSSYKGIVAGSRRTSPDAKGKDILGDGVWDDSKLNDVLLIKNTMPLGRPQDIDLTTVMVYAGSAAPGGQSSATPAAPADVAQPSNPGGPGDAVNLTGDAAAGFKVYSAMCEVCHGAEGKQGIENPGSNDGTVPPLNPIDSTLINADYKTYATNVDLFIQHGSTPAGSAPAKLMPAWGDQKTLTQQQIADVIAYIISLNPAPAGQSNATPAAPADVAQPSNPGGPGDAVNLTGNAAAGLKVYTGVCEACHGKEGKQGIDNPGSNDGTVPPLNPIDSTLINSDYKTYATNLDLFIQHGSTPAGSAPAKLMPAWGDQKTLTQQQIADVIAYIISLNPAPQPPAEVARPSNPGGPGDAVNLTGDAATGLKVYTAYCQVCHGTEGKQGVDNPGSNDGSVPPLNPIDSTLIAADYKAYATNLDLFIQHGSTPAGSAPAKLMPAWGDQKTMTQQQIADVIAYIISLNPTK